MNTKHTPGPWFITEGPIYGNVSRLKVEAAADAQREYGMVIMERTISTGMTGTIDQECLANARLIAAAPELLAVSNRTVIRLNEAMKYVKGDGKAHWEIFQAIEDLNTAIAKATGTTI